MPTDSQPEPTSQPDALPPPPTAPAPPMPIWLRGMLAISLFGGLPAVAAVVWFFGILSLALASDAGASRPAQASFGESLFNAGMGVCASVGMPAALAVLVAGLRKPMLALCAIGVTMGVGLAVGGVVTFLNAL